MNKDPAPFSGIRFYIQPYFRDFVSMKTAYLAFIKSQKLYAPDDRLLVGVSGGMDSMALAHLCAITGQNFGVAHCNFGLRGAESDGDEAFVREWCAARGVPFHVAHFETEKIAREHGKSIQTAARDLRYAWFEKIAQQSDYQYIATAHHLN
ncbi:MAG: tRNA lysidine(34) synthetase TilS, partial [Bacteroidetes bacterium]